MYFYLLQYIQFINEYKCCDGVIICFHMVKESRRML